MYGRKLKKKVSRGPSSVGTTSNWGPRIALEAQQEAKLYGRRPENADYQRLPGVFKNPYAQAQQNSSSQVIYGSKYGKTAVGNNIGSEVSNPVKKPLTVIIPNQKDRRYDYAYDNGRRGDSDGRRRPGHHSYDSLPSTETWRSSDSEQEREANEGPLLSGNNSNEENENNGHNGRRRQVQLTQMRSLPKETETIEVRVPSRKIRQVPEGGVAYAEYHLDLDSESSTSSAGSLYSRRSGHTVYSSKGVKGQPFGIPMVYVPMERNTDSPNATREPVPESVKPYPAEISAKLSLPEGIDANVVQVKDPDGDSLLESFDSVLFKPNPKGASNHSAGSPGNSSGLGSSSSQTNQNDLVFKSSQSKTGPEQTGANKKNLRFSENLDIQGENSASAETRQPKRAESFCKCSGHGAFVAAAILPCGHSKAHDNYSTLSSDDSCRNGHGGGCAERSALQQLRDLSILIGGSFHNPTPDSNVSESSRAAQNNRPASTSPPADSASKLRKTSNTTATSADSGKGSAQTQSASNRSNTSPPVDEEDNSCIFRPDCQECLTASGLYRNPFERYSLSDCTGAPSFIFQGPPATASRKQKVLRRKAKFAKNSTKSKSKVSGSNRGGGNRYVVPEIRYQKYEDACDCTCSCPTVSPISHRENISPKLEPFVKPENTENSVGHFQRSNLQMDARQPIAANAQLFTIAEEDECGPEGGNSKHNNGRHGADDSFGHSHPKCWLAPDPALGWSDLESLYSANFQSSSPLDIDGECWRCWREMSELKRSEPSNTTIERTKRMFIWLNRRPKEFSAPWWEAKKDASMKWILTKAFRNLPQNSSQLYPFRESKKDKLKLRLKDEVIRDLTNGKLYTLALLHLYSQSGGTDTTPGTEDAHAQLQLKPGEKLTLWEIIKVLCRKSVYVAQPSDMKLTEGTLRQRRPLRVAAHIALIEAVMRLYAVEIVKRERVSLILNSFGHTLRPEAQSPEDLIISWINSAITTLKSHILLSNQIQSSHQSYHPPAPYAPPPPQSLRWLNAAHVTDLRDLSDGVGISALFALYFSNEVRLDEIAVPEVGEVLNLYDMTQNHGLIQKRCADFFPEKIYHLSVSDFLYVHGYMKQNVLAFLIDLFKHLEVNPIVRVNRLTQVPLHFQL